MIGIGRHSVFHLLKKFRIILKYDQTGDRSAVSRTVAVLHSIYTEDALLRNHVALLVEDAP